MQGFNMGRYVPPDQEGVLSGNQLHRKRPPGAGAAPTVRFEMPFAVWCGHCPRPTLIAQGVRFNAAKRRVGSYHSTAVFAFRLRHPPCGGEIEIRTDPRNTAYVVTEGGRAREESRAAAADSLVADRPAAAVRLESERADMREQAFARLERTIADRAAAAGARLRVDELREAAARSWEDPYARNQRLRRAFRAGRLEREAEAAAAEALRGRMSLGIELVPARKDDAVRAGLVEFGGEGGAGAGWGGADEAAMARPLFETEGVASGGGGGRGRGRGGVRRDTGGGTPRPKMAACKTRDALVSRVVSNTRAAKDPFLAFGARDASKAPARLPGVSRKRQADEAPDPPSGESPAKAVATRDLVNYDSD